MATEEIQEGVERLERERYRILLGILVLLLAVGPFFSGTHLTHIVFSILLLYGIFAMKPRRLFLWFSIAWVVTDVGLSWTGVALQSRTLETVGLVMDFVFIAILAAMILRRVLRARAVTGEIIAGAICVYLLLGLLWAVGFALLERAMPGSFPESVVMADDAGVRAHGSTTRFIYFSFVTLTTLGYGDITPQTTQAGMFAALEAVTGQLFVAILIAALVSIYANSPGRKSRGRAGRAGDDDRGA